MEFSKSSLKGILLSGSSLSWGVAGVSLGSYRIFEYSDPTAQSYFNRSRSWIDSSNLNISNGENPSLSDSVKVFLETNVGCYYRYFRKDLIEANNKVGVLSDNLSTESSGTPSTTIPKPKKGCAVMQKLNKPNTHTDHGFRAEVALMNDNDAELFYVLYSSGDSGQLQIYKYKFKKSSNKWKLESEKKLWTSNQDKFTFKYYLQQTQQYSFDGDSHDKIRELMLENESNESQLEVSQVSSGSTHKWEVTLKGKWARRDEYCNKYKDKKIFSEDIGNKDTELKKIEEWCSSVY